MRGSNRNKDRCRDRDGREADRARQSEFPVRMHVLTELGKFAGNSAPLVIAGWIHKGIGQSSSHRDLRNQITVTLSTTVSLYQGSVLTLILSSLATFDSSKVDLQIDFCIICCHLVSRLQKVVESFFCDNLTNAAVNGQQPALQQISEQFVFEHRATFTPTSASSSPTPIASPGRLTINTASNSTPNTLYIFAFNVTNAPVLQASTDVTATASAPYIPPSIMQRASGAGSPLRVLLPATVNESCSNLRCPRSNYEHP